MTHTTTRQDSLATTPLNTSTGISPGTDWLGRLKGRFVVFDGPDGSGKTTQFTRFVKRCEAHGLAVCEVREPGGTGVGERIREILLDNQHGDMSLRCEMLLYMASRSQLVEQRIKPALKKKECVLADRFISSTIAYQGAAGGLPIKDIEAVGRVVCDEIEPDLVVIFDVDESTASTRMGASRDRMESKGGDSGSGGAGAFRAKVRRGFLDQAARDPDRHLVIEAVDTQDAVEAALLAGLEERTRAWSG